MNRYVVRKNLLREHVRRGCHQPESVSYTVWMTTPGESVDIWICSCSVDKDKAIAVAAAMNAAADCADLAMCKRQAS